MGRCWTPMLRCLPKKCRTFIVIGRCLFWGVKTDFRHFYIRCVQVFFEHLGGESSLGDKLMFAPSILPLGVVSLAKLHRLFDVLTKGSVKQEHPFFFKLHTFPDTTTTSNIPLKYVYRQIPGQPDLAPNLVVLKHISKNWLRDCFNLALNSIGKNYPCTKAGSFRYRFARGNPPTWANDSKKTTRFTTWRQTIFTGRMWCKDVGAGICQWDATLDGGAGWVGTNMASTNRYARNHVAIKELEVILRQYNYVTKEQITDAITIALQNLVKLASWMLRCTEQHPRLELLWIMVVFFPAPTCQIGGGLAARPPNNDAQMIDAVNTLQYHLQMGLIFKLDQFCHCSDIERAIVHATLHGVMHAPFLIPLSSLKVQNNMKKHPTCFPTGTPGHRKQRK